MSTRSIPSLRYQHKIRLGQASLLVAFFLYLEYLVRTGAVPPVMLVSPAEIGSNAVNMLETGEIQPHIFATLTRVLLAFLLATAVGFPIGWILWKADLLKQILDPYLIVLYAMPIFVFYPIFIMIFGLNQWPIILIAFAMSITIIVINTANGFQQVPQVYRDLGRSLNLSRVQAFRHIYLPAATPYIFTGLKLGFIYASVGVISSEFILANSGLGYLVSYSYSQFYTSDMYVSMVFVIVIAVLANATLIKIENYLYYRGVQS